MFGICINVWPLCISIQKQLFSSSFHFYGFFYSHTTPHYWCTCTWLSKLWSDSCLNKHLLISKAGPFDQVAFLSTFQLRFADRFLDIQLSEEFTLCVLSHDQRVHQYVICTLIHGCLGIVWPSLWKNFSIIRWLALVLGYQLTPHLTALRTKYLFVCVRYKHTSK